MRLCTIADENGHESAAVVVSDGVVMVDDINQQFSTNWPTDVFSLLQRGLDQLLSEQAHALSVNQLRQNFSVKPLYRHCRKIIGIGLNYLDHAKDLNAPHPTEPASFMKGDNTIIGFRDPISLPSQSKRVTAEAELAVVIGKTCRGVSENEAMSCVAGFCLVIDMTAEDILQRNPRFLTKAKNFDTFFSFGPELITPDELPDILSLRVGTWKNGELYRENTISNMAFQPAYLVSHFSDISTLYPGDIISTGTPGATPISSGDEVECRVAGFQSLINTVA
jgi:2-keto-4-pentenoate hydratase/2-oxohepta-3-ene-1,7-dioic acid hydratase in catechol pathway